MREEGTGLASPLFLLLPKRECSPLQFANVRRFLRPRHSAGYMLMMA